MAAWFRQLHFVTRFRRVQTMWGLPPLLSRPARPTNLVLGEIELSPLEVPCPHSPARWGTTSPPGLHDDGYLFLRMALQLLFCLGPFPFRLQLFSFLPDAASTQTDLPIPWLVLIPCLLPGAALSTFLLSLLSSS